MKTKEIKAINLIKTICAIGIIIYHFSCHLLNKNFLPFYTYKNGDWGSVFVTIFFIVSGFLLYNNYSEKIDLKKYYFKRWKAIFPMFYIAYIIFELKNMIIHKSIFFRGSILPYFFTIIGMDGYLVNNFNTYYILGEWFLGIIIILYLIFPILKDLLKKYTYIFLIIIPIIFLIFLDTPIIVQNPFWSITSCLFSFSIGMILNRFKDNIINNIGFFISIVLSIILIFISLNISENISNHLLGTTLFITLFIVGNKIMNFKFINIIFKELSKISYAIFLLQHIIITSILNIYNPNGIINVIAMLLLTILITIISAELLFNLNYIIDKLINKWRKHDKKRRI